MAASAATLNLHGDQDGFTMRTFEACGVGGVQLIDRTDVGGLYDDGVRARLVDLDRGAGRAVRARPGRPRLGRRAARSGGRARTLAEHTFDHRVAVLEELGS